MQSLGIEKLSKSQVSQLDGVVKSFRERPLSGRRYKYVWLDALAVKCREEERIVNVACLVGGSPWPSGYTPPAWRARALSCFI